MPPSEGPWVISRLLGCADQRRRLSSVVFEFCCLQQAVRRVQVSLAQIYYIVFCWWGHDEERLFCKEVRLQVCRFIHWLVVVEEMIVVILKFLSKLWSLQSFPNWRGINFFYSKCFYQSFCRSKQLFRTLLINFSVYLIIFNSNKWLVYDFNRLRTFGI